jgi:hypothetical protein
MTFNTTATSIAARFRHSWRLKDDKGITLHDAIHETGAFSCYKSGYDSMFVFPDGSILGILSGCEWHLIDHTPTLTPHGHQLLWEHAIDPDDYPTVITATLTDQLDQVWAVEMEDGTYHDVDGTEWRFAGGRHTGVMVSA